ncbi:hypothetical protein GWI24_41125 [Streptomyces sp. MK37H]|nr:hypothetical protein [Streptomyces sp. MK37H]
MQAGAGGADGYPGGYGTRGPVSRKAQLIERDKVSRPTVRKAIAVLRADSESTRRPPSTADEAEQLAEAPDTEPEQIYAIAG